jgi:uncharacterized Zn-binding protein involved in type VI secretion
MVTGVVPHVGGPIVAPGEPTVLIGFLPAARATDMAICVGPPDTIAMGSPTVLIGNLMAARIGDPTEHGGVIVLGEPTVMIGEMGMGGAGTEMGMGMSQAKSSAVGTTSQNPSIYSKPASPQALVAVPISFIPPRRGGPLLFDTDSGNGSGGGSLQGSQNGQQQGAQKDKQITCGIVPNSATLTCSHGRKAIDGLLEVVPDKLSGDSIHGVVQSIGGCGQHPQWVISGFWTSNKQGNSISFDAMAWQKLISKTVGIPVWLGDLLPHSYAVHVAACSGPSYYFDLNAYSNDKQSGSFDAKLYDKTFKIVKVALTDTLSLIVEDFQFTFLEGSGSYSLQWEEYKKAPCPNLAFYSWSFKLSLMLISINGRVPLGGNAIIPAELRKYVNAGFFLEASGSISAELDGKRTTPKLIDEGYFKGSSDSSVELKIGISVLAAVFDYNILKIEADVSTGIKLDWKASLKDEKPVVDGEVTWTGLGGEYTVTVPFLKPDTGECTFIPERTLWTKEYYPFGEPPSDDDSGGGDEDGEDDE